MTDNLKIWNALSKTDPKHTKSFKRQGGFSGTAIKPIWSTRMMTEQFGPCGEGWGMTKPEFITVPAGDEMMVYCTIGLWHSGNRENLVYGVGGDKVYTRREDRKVNPPAVTFQSSDEAFKAAYTDALSNAMKQIGVGADVHMGLFDDHKYVREMEREFSDNPPPAPKPETPAVDPNKMTKAQRIQALADKLEAAIYGVKTTDELDLVLTDIAFDEMQKLHDATHKWLMGKSEEVRNQLAGIPFAA